MHPARTVTGQLARAHPRARALLRRRPQRRALPALPRRRRRHAYEGGHEGQGGPPYAGRFTLVVARSQDRGATWLQSVVDDRVAPRGGSSRSCRPSRRSRSIAAAGGSTSPSRTAATATPTCGCGRWRPARARGAARCASTTRRCATEPTSTCRRSRSPLAGGWTSPTTTVATTRAPTCSTTCRCSPRATARARSGRARSSRAPRLMPATGGVQRRPPSSERVSMIGLPDVNRRVPTSRACTQLMYSAPLRRGSAVRRTWKASGPVTRRGVPSVRPASRDDASQTALGVLPRPCSVT